MSTLNELKQVLKDTLEERGILKDIRSKVRAEIFKSLQDEAPENKEITDENKLINSLIVEYLEYNGYLNSLSVF